MAAEYRKVSDETLKIFNEVLDSTSIPQWVEFEVVADDDLKAKEGYVIRKQNKLNEFLTEGTQVVLILNEEIFDEMEEEYQKKLLEEAVSGVVADLETGAVRIEKHDFTTNSGFLEKHGADDVLLLKMSVISLLEAKKQREDEEKERLREAKKKNKN